MRVYNVLCVMYNVLYSYLAVSVPALTASLFHSALAILFCHCLNIYVTAHYRGTYTTNRFKTLDMVSLRLTME